MEYMLMFYLSKEDQEVGRDPAAAQAYQGGWMSYVNAMHQSGHVKSGAGLQGAETGDDGARPGRQAAGAGRPVRRHQGAARRLLRHRRARPRRGAGVGGARAVRVDRRRRGAAGAGAAGGRPALIRGARDGASAVDAAEPAARRAATAGWSPSSPRARATSPPPRTRSATPSPRRSPLAGRGVPDSPEAWLLTVGAPAPARRAGATAASRPAPRRRCGIVFGEVRRRRPTRRAFPDERLKLMFVCAHPAIDRAARPALMLQVVLGLDAARIASAFLVAPAALAQRLVRAKTKIRAAGIAFEVPERGRMAASGSARCWRRSMPPTAPAGTSRRHRPAAARPRARGARPRRLLARLLPDARRGLGPAGAARSSASRAPRRGATPSGDYVPLAAQDAALWDARAARGGRGARCAARRSSVRPGPYQLEAAIQSAHTPARPRRRACRATPSSQLYDALVAQPADDRCAGQPGLRDRRGAWRGGGPRGARRARRRTVARPTSLTGPRSPISRRRPGDVERADARAGAAIGLEQRSGGAALSGPPRLGRRGGVHTAGRLRLSYCSSPCASSSA